MIVHRMTKNERLPDTSYAHSVAGHSEAEWETLADHARTVADFAGEFAAPFGWAGAARVAGLLHDAGKASAEFQAYLKGQHGGVDHSTFGARLAGHLYSRAGHILAPCIAGHHAGLPDGPELERRLAPEYRIPDAADWQRHIAAPPKETLVPARNLNGGTFGQTAFAQSFLIRMLFSCLVDADFLATEAFYAGTPVRQGEAGNLAALETRLICFIADLQANAKRNTLNSLRAEILSHALAKASEPPGFFTLTVPTGGGKTLTSLRFALAHARAHGLRRVIYLSGFTKTLSASLRVVYAAAAAPVLEAMTRVKLLTSIASSEFAERVVYHTLTEGYDRFTALLRQRLRAAQAAAQAEWLQAGWELFPGDRRGMFLWARHPGCQDSVLLAQAAAAAGFWLAPGSAFDPEHRPSPWLRFNVAYRSPALSAWLKLAR